MAARVAHTGRGAMARAALGTALGVAALLAATALPARAQQPVRLEDADVARLLPLIGAAHEEVGRRRDLVDALLADNGAAERFAADVEAGRVDVEAVLRQHSPHASVPTGARYDGVCSRSMVLPGSSGGVRGMFALAYRLTDDGAASGGVSTGRAPSGVTSNGRLPDGASARAVAHYRGRGFSQASHAPAVTWLAWPDPRADSLLVGVGRIFRADDGSPGCRHLVGASVVVLRLPSFAITARERASAPAASRAAAARARAQARAGVSPQQLDESLGAAMIARADAAEDAELEQLARLAAESADFRPLVDARRRNVAWYRRHRAALEPALGRYVDQMMPR